MDKEQQLRQDAGETLRLRPDLRLCAQLEQGSLTRASTADRDRTDFRIADDLLDEYIL